MQLDTLSLFSIALVLFIMMDPIGNITSYLTLFKDVEEKRRPLILLREMLIALSLMFLFAFIGEYIFSILEISDTTVKISSGLILFLTAIKILFPASNSFRKNLPKDEPFIIPFATPLIAGPSLLATIMLYARMETSVSIMIEAILVAWFVSLLIFLVAPLLKRYLGNNGLMALERLTAMVLVMLAIQRFMEGIKAYMILQPWTH